MSQIRVRRRGQYWGVQEKGRWFWRWIGPFGLPDMGRWKKFSDAVWFADLCDRVDKRKDPRP